MTGCQENVQPTAKSQPSQEVQIVQSTSATVPEKVLTENVQAEKVNIVKESLAKTPPKATQPLTAAKLLTLRLIEQGENALAQDRLLTPVDDNANLYFQAALGRDPGNFKAIQGITAIVDRYTQWAWQAAQSRDYVKSARFLDFARSVNPEDPSIVEMASRVKDLRIKRENATKVVDKHIPTKIAQKGQYILPENLFSLSEEEIIAKIQPIIDDVAKTKQSIVIYWPNDKEARLIYQIINSRVTEFRVRAMTYHRADYMVELQQD